MAQQEAAAVNPYLIYVKLGAAALALAGAFGGGFYFGGLQPKTALAVDRAATATAVTSGLLTERSQATAQAVTDNKAESVHDQTIESLPARIVRTPVFLRTPADLCPDPVPSTQAQTAGNDPGGRGTQPRSGEGDIRPAIEAFKLHYETVLADCRRLDAEWPK